MAFPQNQGQKARDALAAAVNRTIDEETTMVECLPQIAADVIEQRDELLKALEALVADPVRYNNERIEIECSGHGAAMNRVMHARLAIALARGQK